jgi:hypothetical protein
MITLAPDDNISSQMITVTPDNNISSSVSRFQEKEKRGEMITINDNIK